MKEKPILFSTPMVQAILENRKTMTRRTQGLEKVNENPDEWRFDSTDDFPSDIEDKTNELYFEKLDTGRNPTEEYIQVKPQYHVGDHIWVKESYYAYGYWVETGKLTKTCKIQYKFIDLTIKRDHKYMYETESKKPNKTLNNNAVKDGLYGWFKRSSLFMPQKAARIWLECTGVRCERLQSISERDAIAEGIEKVCDYGETGYKDYTRPDEVFSDVDAKLSFVTLWESINGKGSVESNPWVFVYEFKRIEKP